MTIKQNELNYYEETGRKLSNISQLKLFNILIDHDGTKFMNIFRSFNINEEIITNTNFYDVYEVGDNIFLDDISYEVYDTPFLWWVIALVNNIVNPFEEIGEEIEFLKYLKKEYLYTLFRDIEGIANLT